MLTVYLLLICDLLMNVLKIIAITLMVITIQIASVVGTLLRLTTMLDFVYPWACLKSTYNIQTFPKHYCQYCSKASFMNYPQYPLMFNDLPFTHTYYGIEEETTLNQQSSY